MSSVLELDPTDRTIYSCLNLERPQSFFLFAGAGSGKTRSLVRVLQAFRSENVSRLRLRGQRVAVITYTNAACDEIKRRLEFDETFSVSTIHSFCWELIKPHQEDIRQWLRENLQAEIEELEEQQRRGRAGTKAAEDRPRKIAAKKRRLETLSSIRKFSYDPNGDNSSRGSLNHAEVIQMAAAFLKVRPLMSKILVRTYPVVLIDESQDTKKELIDAFFHVQETYHEVFSLGLFGDTMQRIYSDGKPDLGGNISDTWEKPAKTINYRCPRRVVALINKIRADVDERYQEAAKNIEGTVRLFVVDTRKTVVKSEVEAKAAQTMAEVTADQAWVESSAAVKVLTLEHHMAAKRGGFSEFFDPLYEVERLRTGLLDGSLPGVSFLSNLVLPLIGALRSNDQFAVARILNRHSPLLSVDQFRNLSHRTILETARGAANKLLSLWETGKSPRLIEILREVHATGLFVIPDVLMPIAVRGETKANDADEDRDMVIDAWDKALACSFDQFEGYVDYISDTSRFGTHQGIKGLEFPRVMVIIDDQEARGFQFSYDKLFGAKEPSPSDKKNELDRKDTAIDRSRRLFYVTCSRAKESLAVVVYTDSPESIRASALQRGWFHENEVIDL